MSSFPRPAEVVHILKTYTWSKTVSVSASGTNSSDIDAFIKAVIDDAASSAVPLKGVRIDSVYFAAISAAAFYDAKNYNDVLIVRSPSLDDLIEFVKK